MFFAQSWAVQSLSGESHTSEALSTPSLPVLPSANGWLASGPTGKLLAHLASSLAVSSDSLASVQAYSTDTVRSCSGTNGAALPVQLTPPPAQPWNSLKKASV